jgi:hypothetical protein
MDLKNWYIYIMEHYPAIRNNEIMSFEEKWMELEITTLSKITQAQKAKYHIFAIQSRPKMMMMKK